MQLSWHFQCRVKHKELCRVCGVKHKHDKLSIQETFVSCSNPKFVECFLRENLEIEVDISYYDLLCFSCYNLRDFL